MRIGVYPGTFDPLTNGHLNIIERCAKMFDQLYVVIPNNVNKATLFSVDERLELLNAVVKEYPNIICAKTDLLTVDFCQKVGANVIVRGLRMVSDFEYELQLAAINKSLNANIETIFIMSDHAYSFLSSSSVKEIAKFHGDVSHFVPKIVEDALNNKMRSL